MSSQCLSFTITVIHVHSQARLLVSWLLYAHRLLAVLAGSWAWQLSSLRASSLWEPKSSPECPLDSGLCRVTMVTRCRLRKLQQRSHSHDLMISSHCTSGYIAIPYSNNCNNINICSCETRKNFQVRRTGWWPCTHSICKFFLCRKFFIGSLKLYGSFP